MFCIARKKGICFILNQRSQAGQPDGVPPPWGQLNSQTNRSVLQPSFLLRTVIGTVLQLLMDGHSLWTHFIFIPPVL